MKVLVIFEFKGIDCNSPQADDIINDVTAFTVDHENACDADCVYVHDAHDDDETPNPTEEGEAQ
jgi:hypothetical protein